MVSNAYALQNQKSTFLLHKKPNAISMLKIYEVELNFHVITFKVETSGILCFIYLQK